MTDRDKAGVGADGSREVRGIVRKLDDLARLVLPKELLRRLGIEAGDSLEIFTDNRAIVLVKYAPGCVFCGGFDGLADYKGRFVCGGCASEMAPARATAGGQG